MSEPKTAPNGVSRRGVLTGTGAALAAAAFTRAAAAGAAAVRPGGDGMGPHVEHPDGSPITSTIGSAPKSGYIYRFVTMYDFFPFDPAAQKTWGGYGVYSAGVKSTMRALFEIPPGAVVRDVEFYVHNASGSSAAVFAGLASAGNGVISAIGAAGVPSGGDYSVILVTVDAAKRGPYPLGTRLTVDLTTPPDGSVQINGARVGYTGGGGAMGLLHTPVRVYDSRKTGGKFRAGETRTITLPPSIVVPGVAAVLVTVEGLQASKAGSVKAWSAAATEPDAAVLHFTENASVSNAVTVGVSAARKIKVFATSAVHIALDVSGTIS